MNKIINYSKIIIKTMILDLNYIFSNKLNLIFLISLIFPMILASCFFVPLYQAGPLFYELSISIPMMIAFGSIYYSFKKTTIYKNLELTKNSNLTFYISLYFIINIIGMLLFIFSILILVILNQFGIIQNHWGFDNELTKKGDIQFLKLNFMDVFWAFFCSSLVSFGMSYFFTILLFNQKSFFIFIFLIMLMCIFFGGLLNDYFSYRPISIYGESRTQVFSKEGGFSLSLFFPFLIFFPFFSIGTAGSLTFERISDFNDNIIHPNIFHQNDLNWNIVIFMPIIHFIILILLGFIIRKWFIKKTLI